MLAASQVRAAALAVSSVTKTQHGSVAAACCSLSAASVDLAGEARYAEVVP
ncbi:MAG TPA: hypothetical protein VGC79_37230 [Polyangiaceae bacterium]